MGCQDRSRAENTGGVSETVLTISIRLTFSLQFSFTYFYDMSTILIKADKSSNKILASLAEKLGGSVIDVNDEQFEDLMLGTLMDRVKTGKTVSKAAILKKLRT